MMTWAKSDRRYRILENLTGEKRCNYKIELFDYFISIRNIRTEEGIYTDDLQQAKRWILKDMKNN